MTNKILVLLFIIFTGLIIVGCPTPHTSEPEFEDSDGDGVEDILDKCDGGDDRLDYDEDGVPDDCDNCQGHDDNLDADGDGVPDGCDMCVGDNRIDSDADGVPDDCDVCPDLWGAGQIDTDQDGLGDDCDNCPDDSNADQADSDGDGIGDACDNCPNTENADQADSDGDGIGDACEAFEITDVCDGVVHNSDGSKTITICAVGSGGNSMDFELQSSTSSIGTQENISFDSNGRACVEFIVSSNGDYWWMIWVDGNVISSGKIRIDSNNQDCTYTGEHDTDL